MIVFSYKKRLYLNDLQAEALKLRLNAPYVFLWIDKKNRVYLTNTKYTLIKYKYMDCFNATFTKTGWYIDTVLPFPWEDNYCFIKLRKGFYQLINKPRKLKDAINGKPKIKTLPKCRCRKTKTILIS